MVQFSSQRSENCLQAILHKQTVIADKRGGGRPPTSVATIQSDWLLKSTIMGLQCSHLVSISRALRTKMAARWRRPMDGVVGHQTRQPDVPWCCRRANESGWRGEYPGTTPMDGSLHQVRSRVHLASRWFAIRNPNQFKRCHWEA